MRKVLIVAVGVTALAGCSKSADHAATNAAGAPGAAPPSNPIAAAAKAMEPRRKAGLWQMAVSTTGGPGMSLSLQTCIDAAHASDFNVKPPASARTNCSSSKSHPIAGGWAFESTCTTNGRTMKTTGTVTGDLSSGYHMEASTQTEPPMQGMAAVAKTNIDAKWLGACPPGMKPGATKFGGMNLGG
jgi:hypothetical protein